MAENVLAVLALYVIERSLMESMLGKFYSKHKETRIQYVLG